MTSIEPSHVKPIWQTAGGIWSKLLGVPFFVSVLQKSWICLWCVLFAIALYLINCDQFHVQMEGLAVLLDGMDYWVDL